MIRKPQVAGQFYPAGPSALRRKLDNIVEKRTKKEDALGIVSPHAGYVYSGKVAGACFSRIKLTKTIVIIGPNHTGLGAPFSIMIDATWQTPLGKVDIDCTLAGKILDESKYLEKDIHAHTYEHSIEVQLPFIQYFLPEFKIVPIVVSAADFDVYSEIGRAIARVLKQKGDDCLIVASSDMSHYEPRDVAEANDNLAIEAILKLNGKELLNRIKRHNISMCGYGPCICMLEAAKEMGAKGAKLVKYQTSGDVSGDYSSVVGYAGIAVVK